MLLHLICINLSLDLRCYVLGKLGDGHRALVALALNTNRDLALSLLLLTDDEQEWDTLELVVANLTSNLLVTLVNLYAYIGLGGEV